MAGGDAMTTHETTMGWMTRMRRSVARLSRDRRGVAAVEFAFIVPVLLTLYFVTMEVAQAIETNKKVGRISSMVGDLVAQQQSSVTRTELESIMRLGNALIYPYNRTDPWIEVTAIFVPDIPNPQPVVVWSRRMSDNNFSTGAPVNTPVTIPAALRIRDSFLIRTVARLDYRPVLTWAAEDKPVLGLAAAFDQIQMGETYYLRPRQSFRVDCPTC